MVRMADADEIGKVTLFASDFASCMTGSQLIGDGGTLPI